MARTPVVPSARPADLRFVLSSSPSSAAIAVELDGIVDALVRVGVEVRPLAASAAVVIVDHRRLSAAIRAAPNDIIVLGRASRRRLVSHGYTTRRHLVRWGKRGPRLIVPLDSSAAVTWVVGRHRNRWSRRLVARALTTRLVALLPGRTILTVASRAPGVPYVVASAPDAGVDSSTSWVLTLGEGDDLQRAVFLLLDDVTGAPRHALKLCRVSACREALDRDADGLALVAGAGEVAAHAPTLLGRFDVGGTPVSIESAGSGRSLSDFLMSNAGRADKLLAVDAVASWILALGRATVEPPTSVAPELDRIRSFPSPPWSTDDAELELLDRVTSVPGVLAHHDLGTWNVLYTGGAEFTVLDWESARRPALPLWDLVYFVVDALAVIPGPAPTEEKLDRALSTLRGESATSAVLFGWLGRASRALGIEPEAVGPLVTLCWLHHCQSHIRRTAALGGAEPAGPLGHLPRIAERWLADPLLGSDWPAFRSWPAGSGA